MSRGTPRAADRGSYDDPITVAVPGDPDDMDWATGTRFYLPTVKRYVIVEDSGVSDGPDDVGTHLDMWIDGQDATTTGIDNCENQLTNEQAPRGMVRGRPARQLRVRP